MFYRKIEKQLYEYYKNSEEKIPVIDGARQIGKSFIIRETAKTVFKHYVEVNLRDDFDGDRLFQNIRTTKDFYLQLSALYGDNLGNIDDTIVFLDEIQVYPQFLTMLKPLKQEGRFRYIASGSLLGITLKHTFIPMGSINEIKMYPMDFEEYLIASGTGKDVIEYLRKCFDDIEQISDGIHKTILRKFKEYLITGGLPDAVKAMIEEQNIYKVREVQNLTLNYYLDDASKYDEVHTLKIRRIYEMLPSYMENKVKRIVFNSIENKKDSNLEKYQDEFDYLIYSGCVIPVKAVANPHYPLDESQSKNLVKLYYNDVGILTNILYKNNIAAILDNDSGINLGSVYETAAAMELAAHGHKLFYFDSKKTGEVDYLINDYESLSVLPIEIKSGKDQYNFRALPKLVDKEGSYKLKKGVVFGNKNETTQKDDISIYPIYQIMFM